ncbi:MAG UNVERIFIED_CONTAM: hypothetical protein LVR18_02990 [Planctomycetaceae bacterium]
MPAGAVNEQQSITLNVGSATGSFKVTIPWNGRTYTTASLPLTASAADLETAINAAVSSVAGSVAVTKSTDGTAVTYDRPIPEHSPRKIFDNAQVAALTDPPVAGEHSPSHGTDRPPLPSASTTTRLLRPPTSSQHSRHLTTSAAATSVSHGTTPQPLSLHDSS